MTNSSDFNLAALYEALDAQRRARGLTWAGAMREINRQAVRRSRPVSASTATSLRTKAVAEGDGVLQMLLWLKRTPESFIPGHPESETARAWPLDVPAHRILRFDTRALHAALDAQRRDRGLTWAQAAREIGLGESSLTHLSRGGPTGFPHVMRIVRWLDRRAEAFTRLSDW